MATKKSNKSNKSNKTKTTKSTADNSPADSKAEQSAVKSVAEKTTTKTTAEESTAKSTAKSVEAETTDEAVTKKTESKKTSTSTTESKKSCFSGFFKRKYEEKESILTIFKKPKFYGALLGEVVGTMFLAFMFFSIMLMGIANTATYAIAIIAVLIAVYAFSGACLNPIITIGMMASRRMSVIRGIMYIIAEIVGAWLGWLVINAFHLAGGDTAYDIASIPAIGENQFWVTAMVEFIGGIIIAFFFSRALKYKRSVFTFAATVAGGIVLAVLLGYVISAAFLSLNNNFIYNPALAMMMQIFPTSGDNFGEVIGGIFQALSAYALIPMIGGVIGFYFSDFTSRLSDEN